MRGLEYGEEASKIGFASLSAALSLLSTSKPFPKDAFLGEGLWLRRCG
jgi:hypothetical protein